MQFFIENNDFENMPMWIVVGGKDFTEGNVQFISKTKGSAAQYLKSKGWKKLGGLYVKEGYWCSIEFIEILKPQSC